MTGKTVDGIAIVGMAGRFPGSSTLEEFWANLRDGVESITHFSNEQLVRAGVDPMLVERPDYVRAKGVLADADLFDAWFFGFNPREAEITDPQQRIFLECCWEALENAGYNPSNHRGTTGVYAGGGINTYLLSNLMAGGAASTLAHAFQISIHNKNDHLTTRVAYKLNLRGPAITVQTACSSSLVAVSLACQSLWSYQNDMALAGGVSIGVPQTRGYLFEEGGTASPDGHCRAFDARARGTVDGNGAGVVVLKRLEEALNDRDHVYAVITGVAINNDGSQKQGYTAPGVASQAEVIAMAQAMAGVSGDDISYVEAHGTGTPLGDPIEVAALTQAFSAGTRNTAHRCAMGSVKTNIGHLDAAAGIAGLIKTALALQNRQIPPSLHFETPNPQIDFEHSPFRVNARLSDWTSNGSPLRAGVSSFGIGGTNAHVVVEEAPESTVSGSHRRRHVLPLSAKSASALEAATEQLASHLARDPSVEIADVAYTLQLGRSVLPHRRTVVCRDALDAVTTLRSLSPDRVASRHHERTDPPVVFLFPGQGSQYVNMAAALYRAHPAFRREVDRCAELLRPHMSLPLRDVLFPAANAVDAMSAVLDRTDVTQPALFTIEYALARFWMELGLRPQAMLGHSIGEYVAACLAGVFRLEDALALVAFRGRVMQSLPEGVMLAVSLAERHLAPLLDEGMSLAAVNGSAQCVISGSPAAAARSEAILAVRNVPFQRLPASRAFHSAMTEPALRELRECVERIPLGAPQIPYISNVTGKWITAADATAPDYWARHLRHTVRFSDGLDEVLKVRDALLIEVGPGRTLKTLARWSPAKSSGQTVLISLPARGAQAEDDSHFLQAVGEAWLAGVDVSWPALHEGERRGRIPLPTYPFERQRYWIEPQVASVVTPPRASIDRSELADWFYVSVWNRSSLVRSTDHRPNPDGRGWLVFADPGGPGDQISRALRSRGATVATVATGSAFERLGPDAYRVHPTARADYRAVLDALGTLPGFIVHTWMVGEDLVDPGAGAADRGLYSLLALAQALGERSAESISLSVISTGLQHVVNGDTVCPEKSMLLGAVRGIPREYDQITARSIDLVLSDLRSEGSARLIDAVLDETAAAGTEPTSAWRGGQRWIQQFERTPVAPVSLPVLLKHRGVYLITGGFGGVGTQIAEYLARGVQARLILLGRSELPARDQWDRELAARQADDPIGKRLRLVRQLEAVGAEVLTAAADVTDHDVMARVFQHARATFGGVDGVIHAAGIAGGGMIQLRRPGAIARVLAPKVAGARVIEKLIAQDRPDFLVLASSLAGVVGRPGQADYCAANAFLDAFARDHAARTGVYTVSIDWPEWRGVGMAAAGVAAPHAAGSDHPLLGTRTTDASGAEVYSTRLRVDTHWVLDEHRLIGTAVVPGTSYIEMVRAALADRADGRCIEIRDLFFLAPLRVANDRTREIRLVLTPAGDGFDFVVESDVPAVDADALPGVVRYASGQVSVLDALPPPRADLADIIARCPRRDVPREEDREEDLGPRWQNVVASHVGHDEVLVDLELQAEFRRDLETIHYHPALMDRATGRAQEHLVDGNFLPITYRRLRIHGRVPGHVFSHARYRREMDPTGETLTFDTVVLDETGTPLVEIEGFTQKRINDRGAAIKAFSSELAPAESRPLPARQQGMSPQEGIETFERILGNRLGPQVVVSIEDLATELAPTAAAARTQVLEAAGRVRGQSPARHPRPNLESEYWAPRTTIEAALAAGWQDTLGLERVGIHDNFFALGGDSVHAIQIIARLSAGGVRLTPQQFFQHQTIAEIATAVSAGVQEPVAAAPVAAPAGTVANVTPLVDLDEESLQQLESLIEEADAAVPAGVADVEPPRASSREMRFSLFYFADEQAASSGDKYRLYLEGSRFADEHGFDAVWTPERHFHTKGGLYPNPSVLSAALAAATRRIHLRAGSVVLPLHSPLRVAEEWAVVDNLSGGRVGISFTSGWQPNDFALFPEHYREKRAVMFRGIEDVRRLWRGESIPGRDGAGEERQLRVFPRPIQPELPIWLTCSGDAEMFRQAGEIGANVLTALLTQTIDEAAAKIAVYRRARAAAGHDPATGVVTMMIHTFVGADAESVLQIVKQPLCNYLKSHVALIETGADSLGIHVSPDTIEQHLDALAEFAFERYYRTASLIGTPRHCLDMVRRLGEIGVDEAACLVDFGVAPDLVLAGLRHLADLRELARTVRQQRPLLGANRR